MLRRDQHEMTFGERLDRHHRAAARQIDEDDVGLFVGRPHMLQNVAFVDLAD